jgi:hypothetical protein
VYEGGKAMRKVVLLAAALVALAAAPAVPAQSTSFEARFQEFFGRSIPHACSAPFFLCGTGEVAGYGSATSTFEILTFDLDPATACGETTFRYTIMLSSGAGELILTGDGTVCFPGNSFFAPGAMKSFGNPFRLGFTWTVTGGTGAFAGATGSGTGMTKGAGESGHTVLSGTITLD